MKAQDINNIGALIGEVRDKKTNDKIENVYIIIPSINKHATTDENGKFEINDIPFGFYDIEISIIGYEKIKLEKYQIMDTKKTLNVAIEPKMLQLSIIDVRGSDYGTEYNRLSEFQIERQPNPSDDVMKSIMTLPGIYSNGYDVSFHVRGGQQNELSVQIDEHIVKNPFHFEEFPFGPVNSFVSYKYIGGIKLSLGGMTVDEGDKMSGYLNLRTKDLFQGEYPNYNTNGTKLSAGAGIDFLNKQIFINGFKEAEGGSKIGIMLTYRSGNIELARKITGDKLPYEVSYYDLFGKAILMFNDSHTLTFSSLYGYDSFKENTKEKENDTSYIREKKYSNSYNWINWKWISGRNLTLNQQLYLDYYPKEIKNRNNIVNTYKKANAMDYGYKMATEYYLDKRWSMKVGLEYQKILYEGNFSHSVMPTTYAYEIRILNNDIELQNNKSVINHKSSIDKTKSNMQRESGYISIQTQILNNLTSETGIRYDYLSGENKNIYSARALLNYKLNSDLMFRFSVGSYAQLYDIQDRINNPITELSTPEEIIEHQNSIQNSFGIDWKPENGISLKADFYQKNYIQMNYLFTSNIIIPGGISGRAEKSIARGMELFLRYQSADLSGWLSYSLSDTKVYVPELSLQYQNVHFSKKGGWYYRPYDQRHTLSLVLDYSWLERWHLTMQLISHSGRPYTEINIEDSANFKKVNNKDVPSIALSVGNIHEQRYPAHLELDLKLNRKFKLWNCEVEFFIGLLNALDYANYDQKSGYVEITGNSVKLVTSMQKGMSMTPFLGLYLKY